MLGLTSPLERFPITWNHVIEKESLKIKELEHVLIEKAGQLFGTRSRKEAGKLPRETLDEEKNTGQLLTRLAEANINQKAA